MGTLDASMVSPREVFKSSILSNAASFIAIHNHPSGSMQPSQEDREEKWTKEVNLVAWNGGKPKIDIRDWNGTHERMSRGILMYNKDAIYIVQKSQFAERIT